MSTALSESEWGVVRSFLQGKLTPDIYRRWFADTTLVEASKEGVVIGVPNQIYKFFIEDHYMAPLRESLTAVTGRPMDIQFREQGAPAGAVRAATPSASPTPSRPVPAAKAGEPVSPLNPRYTFDAYVVGQNNQMAFAAAEAVSKNPARAYNPLFIYGGTGLGKTHLMHAIGNALAAGRRPLKVAYVTSEDFTNQFIHAVREQTLAKFRKRYRSVDVLMVDDIHFLAGKEATQEEFFHTFNALHQADKQLVLSSDRPASEVKLLEQRLVSRFEWGLSVDLSPPDMETRIAILRKKLVGMKVVLGDDVIEFIATRIRSNVRRLEGALLRVAAYASMMGGAGLTVAAAENLLRDFLSEENRRAVTIEQIQKLVAEVHDLRPSEMTGKKRSANIAFPRQIAMYLSRRLTQCSLKEIGACFGGRDHGTVIHAVERVEASMHQDERVRQSVAYLEQRLQQAPA